MNMELAKQYKLYTVNEVLGFLPAKSGITERELRKLIVEAGAYRKIGDLVLLTESDIRTFLIRCSARKASDFEYPPDEPGLVIFIGDAVDVEADVLMMWSPLGGELDLLENVRNFVNPKMQIVAQGDATPAKVREWAKEMTQFRQYGNWFGPTRKFRAFMDSVRDKEEEEAL